MFPHSFLWIILFLIKFLLSTGDYHHPSLPLGNENSHPLVSDALSKALQHPSPINLKSAILYDANHIQKLIASKNFKIRQNLVSLFLESLMNSKASSLLHQFLSSPSLFSPKSSSDHLISSQELINLILSRLYGKMRQEEQTGSLDEYRESLKNVKVLIKTALSHPQLSKGDREKLNGYLFSFYQFTDENLSKSVLQYTLRDALKNPNQDNVLTSLISNKENINILMQSQNPQVYKMIQLVFPSLLSDNDERSTLKRLLKSPYFLTSDGTSGNSVFALNELNELLSRSNLLIRSNQRIQLVLHLANVICDAAETIKSSEAQRYEWKKMNSWILDNLVTHKDPKPFQNYWKRLEQLGLINLKVSNGDVDPYTMYFVGPLNVLIRKLRLKGDLEGLKMVFNHYYKTRPMAAPAA